MFFEIRDRGGRRFVGTCGIQRFAADICLVPRLFVKNATNSASPFPVGQVILQSLWQNPRRKSNPTHGCTRKKGLN